MVDHQALISLTSEIVVAHLSHNTVGQSELPQLITSIHGSLIQITNSKRVETVVHHKPAVSIRASIKPDYLICLEDGKKLKMLKRHLMVHYGLTPDAYRAKWNLPKDYPMVAPSYAARRRELAVSIGLGRGARSSEAPDTQGEAMEPAEPADQS